MDDCLGNIKMILKIRDLGQDGGYLDWYRDGNSPKSLKRGRGKGTGPAVAELGIFQRVGFLA